MTRVRGRPPPLARDLVRAFSTLVPGGEPRREGASHPPAPRVLREGQRAAAAGRRAGGARAAEGEGLSLEDVLTLIGQLQHRAGVHRASHRVHAPHHPAQAAASSRSCCSDRLDPTLTPNDKRACGAASAPSSPPAGRPRIIRARSSPSRTSASTCSSISPKFSIAWCRRSTRRSRRRSRRSTACRPTSLELPSLLRFGTWVGGDMDGNPDVHAKTIRETLARQQQVIVNTYFGEMPEARAAALAEREPHRRPARARQAHRRIHDAAAGRALSDARRATTACPIACSSRRSASGCGTPTTAAPTATQTRSSSAPTCCSSPRACAPTRARTRGSSTCGACCGASTRSAFTWRRWTSASTRACITRCSREGSTIRSWLTRSQRERRAAAGRRTGAGCRAARRPRRARQAHARRVRSDRCRAGIATVRAPSATSSSAAQPARTTCSPPLLLARWAEAYDKRTGEIALDVAPLFESVDTLERCGDIMRDAARGAGLSAPPRSARPPPVRADRLFGQQQGGWPVRLALRHSQAQRALAQRAGRGRRAASSIFHARGGSIARGGGRIDALVRAAPVEALNGILRLTEQGEAHAAELRAAAHRHAHARARVQRADAPTTAAPQNAATTAAGSRAIIWNALRTIADASREAYRELVSAARSSTQYFRAVTPIDVIERMQIGSRPVHRGPSETARLAARRALGVRLDADAPHAAGLVWRGRGPGGGGRSSTASRARARDLCELVLPAQSRRRHRSDAGARRPRDRRAYNELAPARAAPLLRARSAASTTLAREQIAGDQGR